ncbi:hypothetical protein ACFXHA_18335 [Nocardia sp. NPDC059240]|uniref:hypothetical protein n=1 Tax=Nocardia sp. NPDC059240 TaxID=3346786 RepID=UPI0036CC0E81
MNPAPNTEATGRKRSIEATGFTGIAFALLAFVSLALLRGIPGWGTEPATLEQWFRVAGNRTRLMAMVLIATVASIALLWFIGAIRRRIGPHEDRLFATVFLGSGLIFITVLLTALAVFAVPATLAQQVNAETAAHAYPLCYGLGMNLMTIVAPRIAAVFMLSLSNLGRLTGAFPKWLTVLSTATGVFLLVAVTASVHIAWVMPAWCLVVGAAIVWRRKQLTAV